MGFCKRVDYMTKNDHLQSYAGLMNTLLSQVSPHTHSCTYNPEHLGAMFECPVKSVVYTVEKLCEVTNKIVTQIKSSNFQHILRVLLIKHYNDFPQRTLHGFLKILTIATSEAIAESQGSLIDALHLRYKNTDSDDRRVQNDLQIRLMAPSPCSTGCYENGKKPLFSKNPPWGDGGGYRKLLQIPI